MEGLKKRGGFMNKIWFGMLFIGFVCCAAGAEGSGGFESLTQEMLASGEEAVDL